MQLQMICTIGKKVRTLHCEKMTRSADNNRLFNTWLLFRIEKRGLFFRAVVEL